jgi:hypothetical protein
MIDAAARVRSRYRKAARWTAAAGLALALAAPAEAGAFCGFFVGSSDASLVTSATTVVLMRDGTRTVLSMQNDYRGPPEQFAMVVPVPVVLQRENVKTLPHDVFERIDAMSSPRLVEYWEQDPCSEAAKGAAAAAGMRAGALSGGGKVRADLSAPVVVEAQFAVGEYEIVILSALDSNALEIWLRDHGYHLPDGAEAALRPYVRAGSKFFVAKVDIAKVTFDGDAARLSPLRFHYDSDTFTLPVRLGLLSSGGTQDLLVHILAPAQRYEVANYPNVFIATNLDVDPSVRARFSAFYAALFDRTLQLSPRAIVTEYAWAASGCDPCPGPVLTADELRLLGTDVLPGADARQMVLTRLHARYDKASLGEDLVFHTAPPILGGREPEEAEAMSTGTQLSGWNNFQARYAIRHAWNGPIACAEPLRNQWGGPPDGSWPGALPAPDLGSAPRGGVELARLVRSAVPALGLAGTAATKVDPDFPYSRLAIGFGGGVILGLLGWLAARLRPKPAPPAA